MTDEDKDMVDVLIDAGVIPKKHARRVRKALATYDKVSEENRRSTIRLIALFLMPLFLATACSPRLPDELRVWSGAMVVICAIVAVYQTAAIGEV